MKVVVCVKQVPDTKGGVKFKPDGTLDRAAMLAIMNPDDKAGLEAALRLKDEYGAEVTVLTMGLPKADAVLREAFAMGADKGILVTDRVPEYWAVLIHGQPLPRSRALSETLIMTWSSPAVRQSMVIPRRSALRSPSIWASLLFPTRKSSR